MLIVVHVYPKLFILRQYAWRMTNLDIINSKKIALNSWEL